MTTYTVRTDTPLIGSKSVVIQSVAKDGREPDENEDRAYKNAHRIALADGASASARPEVWAEILVRAFVDDDEDPFHPEVLAGLRRQWHERVREPGLPWYATKKLSEGGAATFVGLVLNPDAQQYSVTAVGDSCVFHLRGPELLFKGPLQRAEQFGQRPTLVTTAGNTHEPVWHRNSYYRPDDILVLASDALAKYLLNRHFQHGKRIDSCEALSPDADFAAWVAAARSNGDLDNDDTTVCVVTV